jgi:vancomycin resistance protein YoaR
MNKFAFIIGGFILLGSVAPARALALVLPRQEGAIQTSVTFTYGDQNFIADPETVNSWREFVELPQNTPVTLPKPDFSNLMRGLFESQQLITTNVYYYNPGSIFNFIKNISEKINQPAQEPTLTIENNKATAFTRPQDGILVDSYKTVFDTIEKLESGATSVPITVSVTKPVKALSETNDLGIQELISKGESSFKGSPHNRRWNIRVGVEKMTGIIIAPGDTFSFNKYLGPVEDGYGFLPELVIKKEGTIPELGGGLCQVSSTTFRAAMLAGLPIKERRNHAYAVQYYSPQGTDATIYPGVVDLKFLNDTPGHILIWPYFKDDNTLIFEFYGTKDDRQVVIKKPVQYDRKPDGSMKATWEREVIKNGEEMKDVFKSVYQSPALFHKTEGFVKSSSSPEGLHVGSFTTSSPAPVLH